MPAAAEAAGREAGSLEAATLEEDSLAEAISGAVAWGVASSEEWASLAALQHKQTCLGHRHYERRCNKPAWQQAQY